MKDFRNMTDYAIGKYFEDRYTLPDWVYFVFAFVVFVVWPAVNVAAALST